MNSSQSNDPDPLQSWLADQWPAIVSQFGIPAKVFYSLTRYLYQLQKQTDNRVSIPPAWEYHIIFGVEFCRELKWSETEYAEALDQLSRTGHVHIDNSQWVLPEHSFLVETDSIPEIELELPNVIWFSRHSLRLPADLRQALATAYALIEGNSIDDVHDKTPQLTNDFDWLLGAGIGLTMHARDVADHAEARLLLLKSENLLRAGIGISSDSKIWSALSYCTYQQAINEENTEVKLESAQRAVQAARKSIAHDIQNDSAWIRLGVSLGIIADHTSEFAQQKSYREQEIEAYEKAIAIDQHDDSYWFNLGSAVGQLANLETDVETVRQLRQKNFDALQSAVDTNPKNHWAWISLGMRYQELAEDEHQPQEKSFLLLKSISANRRALDIDRHVVAAWQNLTSSLDKLAELSTDSNRITALRSQQFQASEQAAKLAPDEIVSWTNLGTAAMCLADAESHSAPPEIVKPLRLQAIDAFRSALELEKLNPFVWFQIANACYDVSRAASDSKTKIEFSNRQLEALQMTVQIEPQFVPAWLNLGHAYRLSPETGVESKTDHLENAIEAYQSAIDLEPTNSAAWANLGWCHAMISRLQNEERQTQRFWTSVQAYETAIDHDEKNDFALSNLAIHFGELYRHETDPPRQVEYATKAFDLFQRALTINDGSFSTWFNYCFFLSAVHDLSDELGFTRSELLDKQIEAAEKSTELNAENENAWLMLGLTLGQSADLQKRLTDSVLLNQRSIEAYRTAIAIDEAFFSAWSSLGIRLIYLWQMETDDDLRAEALEATHHALENNEGHYNAACVFALAGEIEKSLEQLDWVLQQNLVPIDHIKTDPDLKPLRDHERFHQLINRNHT